MANLLKDKVAIVTGASNGIGRGIAEMFAAEGAKTVLVARRKQVLDEVVAGIAKAGGTALAVPADVTKEDNVIGLFEQTLKAYGRVDIVVNNAGIALAVATEDMTLKQWQDMVDVNLTAVFLCSRQAFRVMKAQKPQGGRIINMGSISSKTPRPNSLPYTATKHALEGVTHSLTMDGRNYNIVSSLVRPGATLSEFTARRGRTTHGPGATPDDYVMAPEDVARVVLLMASLPPEVNLYEATILPNHMKSFISRG